MKVACESLFGIIKAVCGSVGMKRRVVVVGSGAGGATVAKELASAGIDVTLIERGARVEGKNAFKCYANVHSAVEIMRAFCLGGTTMVSVGNGVRALREEIQQFGIRLNYEEVERDLGVRLLPESLIGEGTRRIAASAEKLGFKVERMPKFIAAEKCTQDGRCAFGCPSSAKWTALNFVESAERSGARVLTEMLVDEIVLRGGEVKGVLARSTARSRTNSKFIEADAVVLSAGALETPLLLQKASLPTSSSSLFVDTFITVGGVLAGSMEEERKMRKEARMNFSKEVPMSILIQFKNFILSPHFSRGLLTALKQKGINANPASILGIMVKIKDEENGRILADGSVEKGISPTDAEILAEGASIAGAILVNAGVNPNSLVTTAPRGAHPGGTAKIGVSVDRNLETEASGLFVADASLLPKAPGAPPILTIVALAKHAAEVLMEYVS
ncbi:MAG: FAD-dependent oxidoreductase [Candidatus Methanospirare jalkutatii]|nr:FAD-dependent oxidoreductase [Candidatus Methanospirare jalkutatii]